LPPLLTKADLWGADAQNAYQTHAYELAAKIQRCCTSSPAMLLRPHGATTAAQLLLRTAHGAQCATCLKELYYSYQQHQKGKTAAQIRAGIIKGDWKQIDLQSAAAIN